MGKSTIEHRIANTIRFLAVDGVQKARSGHPGMPMGMADCAAVLWTKFMEFHPSDPGWINRDRFILSAGHGSMLLYSLLHLAGFDVGMDDLKAFRQWNSRTPGHPEIGCLPGVETTTGPLGQGFATGVGMALASRLLAQRFNGKEFSPITNRVFGIVSDGDLMEGISGEAASLAGHLGLGNCIYLYDDNRITIEGATDLAFSEDVQKRFGAYAWHTVRIDGHDHQQIVEAIRESLAEEDRPSLILAKTHIAFGSPNKQDSASSHGSPLGEDEIRATKENLGWPVDPPFHVPDDVRAAFARRIDALKVRYEDWKEGMVAWERSDEDRAGLWRKMMDRDLPGDLESRLREAVPEGDSATRVSGGKILQKAAELCPGLMGGSADLAPSTKTLIEGESSVGPGNFGGRNLHFGIREHGMGGILNGMALYGGIVPYGSTFLVFSDYMRPAIRLAALMELPVVYVFTHDSIFVGEDGPTHQPVEHVAALRSIPNLHVFRPADGYETASAWAYALRRGDGPTALCLTRQNVPGVTSGISPESMSRGGYILSKESSARPEIVLVGTGSEVSISLEAKDLLEEKRIGIRVVSMPSLDVFLEQEDAYRKSVVPEEVPLVVVEAGIGQGWHRLTRSPMLHIGMERFGASAPYPVLAERFGFTGEAVARAVEDWNRS